MTIRGIFIVNFPVISDHSQKNLILCVVCVNMHPRLLSDILLCPLEEVISWPQQICKD